MTALLFTVGKGVIGWYLGRTAASSLYGAAGSLIVLLLWLYCSAQIFLFGAELTKATADYRRPRDLLPDSGGSAGITAPRSACPFPSLALPCLVTLAPTNPSVPNDRQGPA
jgi:hypothetical protein